MAALQTSHWGIEVRRAAPRRWAGPCSRSGKSMDFSQPRVLRIPEERSPIPVYTGSSLKPDRLLPPGSYAWGSGTRGRNWTRRGHRPPGRGAGRTGVDHTRAPTEILATGKRVCGSRWAGVWAEFLRVRGGPDDARGEGAGISAPSEGHPQSTCFQVLPRLEHLVTGHTWVRVIRFSAAADGACGGRTSAGVGGGCE